MEAPAAAQQQQAGQPSAPRKKMTKQLTGKRDDTPLHSAARAGNIAVATEILTGTGEDELKQLLAKQNQSGETALYVAAEYGYVDLVREMIKYYDLVDAEIKARNGFDAFHIAAKQGDLGIYFHFIALFVFISVFFFFFLLLFFALGGELVLSLPCFTDVLKVLMETHPELAMTVDVSNTTALHTAATQGHTGIVKFLMETGSSLATIAKSNGKTALHSAARNGHLEVVKALLEKEPSIATRTDKKGQTALQMAVKGQSLEVVEELIRGDPSSINMVDNKGNTALHIASRKGRAQVIINWPFS